MSNILIVGADGQLAFDLINVLEKDFKIIKATRREFDVRNFKRASQFVRKAKPEVVINTAAFHRTSECEKDPKKSFDVNALGAYNTAKAAAQVGSSVFFISTNYVFDGNKKLYDEDDVPNPLNVYGASKLAGEILTKIANPKYYIIRTSGLFGLKISGKGHNFVSLMLEKAKNKEATSVVNDEFSNITFAEELALKVAEFIKKKVPYGIYHLVNPPSVSWYAFAKEVFRLSGALDCLAAISSKDRPSDFVRPKYSGIVTNRLDAAKIKNLRPWKEAVTNYIEQGK